MIYPCPAIAAPLGGFLLENDDLGAPAPGVDGGVATGYAAAQDEDVGYEHVLLAVANRVGPLGERRIPLDVLMPGAHDVRSTDLSGSEDGPDEMAFPSNRGGGQCIGPLAEATPEAAAALVAGRQSLTSTTR